MSGHSKWATIKRQKAAADAKRGQAFTKLGREITIAARDGPDPNSNFRLRLAVNRAREANMPADNIQRAINRASGSAAGESIEELVYEGYGPGGTALYIEVTTDNRKRTSAAVRNVVQRAGGSLGESGSVTWLFEPRGLVTVEVGDNDPDEVAMIAIDAEADDLESVDGTLEVQCTPGRLESLRKAFESVKLNVISAESSLSPINSVSLDRQTTHQVMRLVEKLEELDDVRNVHTNIDLTQELVDSYRG
jgi:YebC/PmpR family DNA-binding regulatory protein